MLRATALTALSLACATAMGCSSEYEQPPGENASPIRFGGAVNPDPFGTAMVFDGHGSCSGTMLTNQWALTAKHCVTGTSTATVIPLAATAYNVSPANQNLHETMDLALLKLNDTAIVRGSDHYYQMALWYGTDQELVGQTATCVGFGNSDAFNNGSTRDTGFGALRTADLTITAANGLLAYAPNAQNQIPQSGDDGGACFVYKAGVPYLVNVNVGFTASNGVITGSNGPSMVGIAGSGYGTVRDWIYATIFPQFAPYWNEAAPLPGAAATDVAIGPTMQKDFWKTAQNGPIDHWITDAWQSAEGGAANIAVAPDGTPWVVNAAHQIYRWNGANWGSPLPGEANDIGIGADGTVWVIGNDPSPGGFNLHKWMGSYWHHPWTGGGTKIAVAPNGDPWVVNDQNQIWHLDTVNGVWILLPGAGRDIGIGSNGTVWVIGTDAVGASDYTIHRWEGVWRSVPGGGVRVAGGPNGKLAIVNSWGNVWLN